MDSAKHHGQYSYQDFRSPLNSSKIIQIIAYPNNFLLLFRIWQTKYKSGTNTITVIKCPYSSPHSVN